MLQGGEDPYFTDDMMCEIISSIKSHYPDCALTLSIGERDARATSDILRPVQIDIC